MRGEPVAVSEKSLNMAESFLRRARKKLGEAEEHLKRVNYPESISASQECIELSIKAMFLLLVDEYPKRHWFRDEEFEALFERIPEELRPLEFPKLFLYSRFWAGFYETAKYGDERLGVGPERLFGHGEAELALRHARDCHRAADRLYWHLRHGK
jgi:HEPN domain-containing protein